MFSMTRISSKCTRTIIWSLSVLGLLTGVAIPGMAKRNNGFGADFNGDGYADLCIGVPGGTAGNVQDAGVVNCLYGSKSGLQATGTPSAQLWSQNSTGMPGVAENGDNFGHALAFGDFNQDAYDDLCIGVDFETVAGANQTGAVNCIYGSASGLQATGQGGPAAQLWYEGTTGIKGSAEAHDAFGFSLTAGDFNGDGYADLCIGIVGKTVNGFAGAGEVNCLYGSATGLQASAGPGDQRWRQGINGVPGTAEAFKDFGFSIIAGDFNFDNFDDLCIGADKDDASGTAGGTVTCLYGSSSGLQSTGAGAPFPQYWSEGSSSVKNTPEDGDLFGFSLAMGDFNNDGYADLAIGTPQVNNFIAGHQKGGVHVFYGSAAGLQVTGTGAPDDQYWTRGSASVKGVGFDLDYFAWALTASDYNHDGFDDLCIGVPVDNVGSTPFAGVSEQGDGFGSALSSGDFNGDSYLDLVVGVPEEVVTTGTTGGAVNVLYGSKTGLQATGNGAPASQLWSQESDGVPGSGGGAFGLSLSD